MMANFPERTHFGLATWAILTDDFALEEIISIEIEHTWNDDDETTDYRGKSLHWIASRHWHRQGRRAWQFAADTGERTPAGKPVWLRLVNPTETKIRRHVKVRADANPFDPHWHDYFEDRAFFRKFGIHRQEAGLKSSSEPAPR
jgi:hypothetical protein